MRSATPVCVRMPVPTIDTLLTSSSCSTVAPNSAARGRRTASVVGSSLCKTVKPMLALPSLPDVLADHVHDDILLGDGGEDAMADARFVRHAFQADRVLRRA